MPLDTGSINIRAHSYDSLLSFSVCTISGNTSRLLAKDWLKAYSFLFCVTYSSVGVFYQVMWVVSFPLNGNLC